MFSFLRKKNKTTEEEVQQIVEPVEKQLQTPEAADQTQELDQTEPKASLFGRLKQSLNRTSSKLTDGFALLF